MTDFDPTDPWGQKSPWDVAQPNANQTASEAPVTNQPTSASPNPFKIGFTLKAATGFEAEWLTPVVYGATAEETAQRGKDLLVAMKANGLIEFTAQAAQYTRGQYLGAGNPKPAAVAPAAQPSFQNGQVQYGNQSAQPPFGGGAPAAGGDSCPHGRTHRSGNNAKGPWEAMFCNERNKSAQCPPMWKQKDGSYA